MMTKLTKLMMTMTKRRMLNADVTVGGIGALSWELMLSLCTGNKQKNNAHDDNPPFHPPQCYFILPPDVKSTITDGGSTTTHSKGTRG